MRLEFAPIWDRDAGAFADWLDELRGASGAYVIRSSSSGEILYVGESHRGRLVQTLTRHFQNWEGPTAGFTYDRNRVEVAILVCPPNDAPDLQYELIGQLQPRDNDGDDDLDDVPF